MRKEPYKQGRLSALHPSKLPTPDRYPPSALSASTP
jgi:hypothetical protein